MTVKKIIFIVGLFLILGCSSKNDIFHNHYSGTLELTEHVLGTKVSGKLSTLEVKEGDVVKKTQVLATMDHFEQAKKDYERTVELFKIGGTNAQSVEYAQLALEDQQITSPINGVVLVKSAEIGETLSAGAAVVVVGNPQDQWIKVFLQERLIGQIKIGQQASVVVDGLTKIYAGHVSFIAIRGEFTPRNLQSKEDRMTQVFAVKVTLDHPDDNVHPGVSAEVEFKR